MAGDDGNGEIHLPEADVAVAVVVVPFVSQGHLNQLFYLSRLISSYNLPVHFVCTTTHLRQLRRRLHGSGELSDDSNPIHFHEIPTPPFTSPPPDPSNPYPAHLQPSFDSTLHLRGPVGDLVLSLSNTSGRVAVVHDLLMSYVVQDVKQIQNAETYIFNPLAAIDFFWRTWEETGRPFPVDPEIVNRIPSGDGFLTPEFIELLILQQPHMDFHVGRIFDSSRAIEGEFFKYLEREDMFGKKKLWVMGPFNPVENRFVTKNRHESLQWLDTQPPSSVIYVSFGTTTTFSDKQIKELAIGLERSAQRFIWVARDADKGDVFGEKVKPVELPDGFEERVEGRGVVVREWAPQLEILGHLATGGFMSHCGWNSCLESMSMGVPMVTWPIHSDQPRNAFLITDLLKIGLPVKDGSLGEELVTSEAVEEVVRKLMDSSEGEEMRRRAAELGGAVRRSVSEGGETRKEIDSFISYVTREPRGYVKETLKSAQA